MTTTATSFSLLAAKQAPKSIFIEYEKYTMAIEV